MSKVTVDLPVCACDGPIALPGDVEWREGARGVRTAHPEHVYKIHAEDCDGAG